MRGKGRTLLIDADDTLWENNIYYETVIEKFIDVMADQGMSKKKVLDTLREMESKNIKKVGYGSLSFSRSVKETFTEFIEEIDVGKAEKILHKVEQLILEVVNHPLVLMPGVERTLPKLYLNNYLIMLTKGNPDEQRRKVEKSGLADCFDKIKIVLEKNVEIYKKITRELKLTLKDCWMIGNSPRSDINPAKEVGMGTVFIPYHTTWHHEIEEINSGGRETIFLDSFSELAKYFA
jgi:putative hydrolase of the HAD superfamily